MNAFTENTANAVLSGSHLKRLVRVAASLPNDPAGGRKGGYFALYDKKYDSMIVKKVGNFPKEKGIQYLRNATEKAIRLLETGEFSSFLSRDEQKKQWGGGVNMGQIICSFSGFPESLDEAVSLNFFFQWKYEDPEFHRPKLKEMQEEFFPKNQLIMPLFDFSIGDLEHQIV